MRLIMKRHTPPPKISANGIHRFLPRKPDTANPKPSEQKPNNPAGTMPPHGKSRKEP